MAAQRIQVCVRTRPLLPGLLDPSGETNAWLCGVDAVGGGQFIRSVDDTVASLRYNQEHKFWFDHVGEESEDTPHFFASSPARDAVRGTLEGRNACLMCYGQTGSGKTFTMRGVVDAAIAELFAQKCVAEAGTAALDDADAADSEEDRERPHPPRVRLSVLEVYNEKVNDLLVPSGTNLALFNDTKSYGLEHSPRAYAAPLDAASVAIQPSGGSLSTADGDDASSASTDKSEESTASNRSASHSRKRRAVRGVSARQHGGAGVLVGAATRSPVGVQRARARFVQLAAEARRARAAATPFTPVCVVRGLHEEEVASWEDARRLIERAWAAKKTAATEKNMSSSRSHTIIRMTVEHAGRTYASDGGPGGEESMRVDTVTVATLFCVDLAGSEHLSTSHESSKQGSDRRAETMNINQSLTTLSHVLQKLAERSRRAKRVVAKAAAKAAAKEKVEAWAEIKSEATSSADAKANAASDVANETATSTMAELQKRDAEGASTGGTPARAGGGDEEVRGEYVRREVGQSERVGTPLVRCTRTRRRRRASTPAMPLRSIASMGGGALTPLATPSAPLPPGTGGGGGQHIPFRNSKLTRILEPALEGNSNVVLICNVAPGHGSVRETLSTLRFGKRAKDVETVVRANRRVHRLHTVRNACLDAAVNTARMAALAAMLASSRAALATREHGATALVTTLRGELEAAAAHKASRATRVKRALRKAKASLVAETEAAAAAHTAREAALAHAAALSAEIDVERRFAKEADARHAEAAETAQRVCVRNAAQAAGAAAATLATELNEHRAVHRQRMDDVQAAHSVELAAQARSYDSHVSESVDRRNALAAAHNAALAAQSLAHAEMLEVAAERHAASAVKATAEHTSRTKRMRRAVKRTKLASVAEHSAVLQAAANAHSQQVHALEEQYSAALEALAARGKSERDELREAHAAKSAAALESATRARALDLCAARARATKEHGTVVAEILELHEASEEQAEQYRANRDAQHREHAVAIEAQLRAQASKHSAAVRAEAIAHDAKLARALAAVRSEAATELDAAQRRIELSLAAAEHAVSMERGLADKHEQTLAALRGERRREVGDRAVLFETELHAAEEEHARAIDDRNDSFALALCTALAERDADHAAALGAAKEELERVNASSERAALDEAAAVHDAALAALTESHASLLAAAREANSESVLRVESASHAKLARAREAAVALLAADHAIALAAMQSAHGEATAERSVAAANMCEEALRAARDAARDELRAVQRDANAKRARDVAAATRAAAVAQAKTLAMIEERFAAATAARDVAQGDALQCVRADATAALEALEMRSAERENAALAALRDANASEMTEALATCAAEQQNAVVQRDAAAAAHLAVALDAERCGHDAVLARVALDSESTLDAQRVSLEREARLMLANALRARDDAHAIAMMSVECAASEAQEQAAQRVEATRSHFSATSRAAADEHEDAITRLRAELAVRAASASAATAEALSVSHACQLEVATNAAAERLAAALAEQGSARDAMHVREMEATARRLTDVADVEVEALVSEHARAVAALHTSFDSTEASALAAANERAAAARARSALQLATAKRAHSVAVAELHATHARAVDKRAAVHRAASTSTLAAHRHEWHSESTAALERVRAEASRESAALEAAHASALEAMAVEHAVHEANVSDATKERVEHELHDEHASALHRLAVTHRAQREADSRSAAHSLRAALQEQLRVHREELADALADMRDAHTRAAGESADELSARHAREVELIKEGHRHAIAHVKKVHDAHARDRSEALQTELHSEAAEICAAQLARHTAAQSAERNANEAAVERAVARVTARHEAAAHAADAAARSAMAKALAVADAEHFAALSRATRTAAECAIATRAEAGAAIGEVAATVAAAVAESSCMLRAEHARALSDALAEVHRMATAESAARERSVAEIARVLAAARREHAEERAALHGAAESELVRHSEALAKEASIAATRAHDEAEAVLAAERERLAAAHAAAMAHVESDAVVVAARAATMEATLRAQERAVYALEAQLAAAQRDSALANRAVAVRPTGCAAPEVGAEWDVHGAAWGAAAARRARSDKPLTTESAGIARYTAPIAATPVASAHCTRAEADGREAAAYAYAQDESAGAYAAAAAVHAPEEYAVADSYAVACDDGFDYVGVERSVSYGADVGVGADEAPCDATYDTAVGGAAEAAEWAYAAAYYAAESAEVATEAAEVATAASAARFASGISAAAGGNGGVDGEGGGLWSGISSWFMDGATPIEGVHALDNFE